MQTRDHGNVRYLACGQPAGPRPNACNDTQKSDIDVRREARDRPQNTHRSRILYSLDERGIVHGASAFLSKTQRNASQKSDPTAPIFMIKENLAMKTPNLKAKPNTPAQSSKTKSRSSDENGFILPPINRAR